MANVLNTDKQIAIIAALTEGSSIRSIERITGVHRDPENPERHVTVLHVHPALSPLAAVRAALMQEYNNAQTA
jgi:hypothetical protein